MENKINVWAGIAVIGIVLIGGCVEEKQKEELCDTESLENCINKNITLEGKLSAEIFQHPLPPYFQQYKNIDYLDTEQGQIVLLSKEKITCKNNIKIYGLLEKVTIDCEPGATGKCPYRGYRVYVHEWECLESENITKQQAIAIASATEEVREFLKLYPDADLFSYSLVNDIWTFTYRKSENYTALSFFISVNETSGETILSDPKLEFLKNRTYCKLDEQCVCLEACVNYISNPKTEFHGVGKCSQNNDCKCVNHTCVAGSRGPYDFVRDELQEKFGQKITRSGFVWESKLPYYEIYENDIRDLTCLFVDDPDMERMLYNAERNKSVVTVSGIVSRKAVDYGECEYPTVQQVCGRHLYYCINVTLIQDQIQITQEQAIAIANATEEVREFLKLYPDANLTAFKSCCSTSGAMMGADCKCVETKNDPWFMIYWKGNWWYPNSTAVKIAINSTSGEILAKYPKLEYIKNSMYCGSDRDCNLVEPICGNPECTPDNSTCEQVCGCVPSSINFIHQTRWEEKDNLVPCTNTDIICKPCAHRNCYEPGCMNKHCAAKWKEGAVDKGFGCG